MRDKRSVYPTSSLTSTVLSWISLDVAKPGRYREDQWDSNAWDRGMMIGAIVLTRRRRFVLLALRHARRSATWTRSRQPEAYRGAIWAVISEGPLLAAAWFRHWLSVSSLFIFLSHADVSLIAPAAGTLDLCAANAWPRDWGAAREIYCSLLLGQLLFARRGSFTVNTYGRTP